jgi:DNA polymerase-3 subunit epsilon
MREIILDTETTGLDPLSGDRLVEIGCIELFNHVPTGQSFQRYINPERDVPEAAFQVHGLSTAFLADKPKFADHAEEFLAFIGDAPLVIHNAEFDLKFVNFELERVGRKTLPPARAIDTVRMARQKFPGAPASLDALCKRFSIDNSSRQLHGALLDAQLLAEVYLELIGGRQTGLTLDADVPVGGDLSFAKPAGARTGIKARQPRLHAASAEELEAHGAFVAKLKNPLWLR